MYRYLLIPDTSIAFLKDKWSANEGVYEEVLGIRFTLVKPGAGLLAAAIVLSSSLAALIMPRNVSAEAGSWGPRVLVTDDNVNNTHWSYEVRVAADVFQNAYVSWQDMSELDGSGPDQDIFIKKWNTSTGTWGPRMLVTDDNHNNTMTSHSSDVHTDSFGNAHVVWMQNGNIDGSGDDVDIFWKMWNATSGTWGPRVLIGDDYNNTENSYAARLASDLSGNIHVVWSDKSPLTPNWGIQYRKWNGATGTWEKRKTVTDNSEPGFISDIAVDHFGDVHVGWSDKANISGASTYDTDYDIFYRKLDASSGNWSSVVHVNDDDDDYDSIGSNFQNMNADVFGNVHIVWDEWGNQSAIGSGQDHDIFYRKWNAVTESWGSRTLLSNDPANTEPSSESEICSDPLGNLHVVWKDRSDVDGAGAINMGDIFYKKWNATTRAWEDTSSLTNDLMDAEPYYADRPDISCDNLANVVVAWEDGFGLLGSGSDYDIFLRRYESGLTDMDQELISSNLDCDPDTLNLKSKGNWITCYIELPLGYDPRDIDAGTILLNDTLSPELDPKYGFVKSEESYIMDHDGDGIEERMVKFDRFAVEEMLDVGFAVVLTLTGELSDGTKFEGMDKIRVINPPEDVPVESGIKHSVLMRRGFNNPLHPERANSDVSGNAKFMAI
jgi:hypothetical protein